MTEADIYGAWMTNENNDYEKYRVMYNDVLTVEISYYKGYGWVFEDSYLFFENRYYIIEIIYDVVEALL